MGAAWVCIPCLLTLRAEFNAASPGRDKGADGTIGNSLHTSSSDHTPDEDSRVLRDHDADDKNEVHALDIDSSGPWPGVGTQKQRFHAIVMRIIDGERRKWRSATDKCRLNYVIWDRKIYDKDNDFQPADYSGDDPHTNHAHFSGRYETSCENDTRPWGVIQEEDMPLDANDQVKIRTIVKEEVAAALKVAFTTQTFPWSADNPEDPKSYQRNASDLMGDTWSALMRGTTRGGDALPTDGAIGVILARLSGIEAALGAIPATDPDDVLSAVREEVREVLHRGSAE